MATKKTLGVLLTGFTMLSGLMTLTNTNSTALNPEDYFKGKQLEMARAITNSDLSLVKSLAGAIDLNTPANKDITILFFALNASLGEEKTHLKIMTELVKAGADPLQRVPDMGSVAGITAKMSGPLYMKALLDGGLSPDSLVLSTPILFYAADDETLPTLELLIKRGADVNKRDSLGATVLMNALDFLQLDTVSWLLDHGADPKLTETNSGWSFSRQLEAMKKRFEGEKNTDKKLDEIISKAVYQGMEWPPK